MKISWQLAVNQGIKVLGIKHKVVILQKKQFYSV